jgi:hypothetical protein
MNHELAEHVVHLAASARANRTFFIEAGTAGLHVVTSLAAAPPLIQTEGTIPGLVN